MVFIDAAGLDHQALNQKIREAPEDTLIENCLGQRFIGAGTCDKTIEIHGIPGNALGAYLNGSHLSVKGNAQDAVGDTMNNGSIIVYGSIGDAAGYAMRGGKIYVKGNAGYRAGIHMKAYQDKKPVMVIGGRAGSFLGEYQAGGLIAVLNLEKPSEKCVGYFPCTGMQHLCIMRPVRDFRNIRPITVMRHLRTGKERTRRAYASSGSFLQYSC